MATSTKSKKPTLQEWNDKYNKIKALADRGVGGEKVTAEAKLKRHIEIGQQYGYTPDNNKKATFNFGYPEGRRSDPQRRFCTMPYVDQLLTMSPRPAAQVIETLFKIACNYIERLTGNTAYRETDDNAIVSLIRYYSDSLDSMDIEIGLKKRIYSYLVAYDIPVLFEPIAECCGLFTDSDRMEDNTPSALWQYDHLHGYPIGYLELEMAAAVLHPHVNYAFMFMEHIAQPGETMLIGYITAYNVEDNWIEISFRNKKYSPRKYSLNAFNYIYSVKRTGGHKTGLSAGQREEVMKRKKDITGS